MGDRSEIKTRDQKLDMMLNPTPDCRDIVEWSFIFQSGCDNEHAQHLMGRFAAEMTENSFIDISAEDPFI